MTCAISNEDIVSSSLKAYASNGMLHVSGLQAGISLRIYNLAGQLIYSGTAKAAEERISLATQGGICSGSGRGEYECVCG